MLKLSKNLKPMWWMILMVVVLVVSQATAELYLPEMMSDIINDGIYLDYEPMYVYEEMKSPFGESNVKGNIEGFDKNNIPVFEMKDGFSTLDLRETWNSIYGDELDFSFQDIPVRDSKELFNDVIMPFMDSLRPYQFDHLSKRDGKTDYSYSSDTANEATKKALRSEWWAANRPNQTMPEYVEGFDYGAETYYTLNDESDDYYDDFSELSSADQAAIKIVIDRLVNYDELAKSEKNITIKTFLTMFKDKGTGSDSDEEDDDWRDNPNAIKFVTTCVTCMKHSENGNLLPIPVVANRETEEAIFLKGGVYQRIDVDSYGKPLDESKVTYMWDDETERYKPFPDYELIICNNVLGYAYIYEGEKWIDHKLGTTEDTIKNDYHKEVLEENKAGFFARLGEYLELSPTGVEEEEISTYTDKYGEVITQKSLEDWLIPDGSTIQRADMGFIWKKGGIMLALTIFASICAIAAMFISARVVANFSKSIRSSVFRKVESFSLAEFDKFSTASLITRSTNDINQIQNVFLMILRTALSAPVTIIGGFILSSQKNGPMTRVMLYCLPVLVIAGLVAKLVQPIVRLIQVKVDQLTLLMRESLTGIRVIRAFNQQDREKKRFAAQNLSTTKSAITINRYNAVLSPLVMVVMNCISLGIILTAAKLIDRDEVDDVGSMMAVMQYATQIMLALVMIATVVVIYPRASASAERIRQVLDTEAIILDKPDAKDNDEKRGSVIFKNVCFKYSDNAEKYILENINFEAEAGKVTAIVGGTGSGKSSVINLIPRFYDIQEGQVLVNGQDVRDYTQEQLRAKIGFVPQKARLFSGTIADNLRYGKEDATEEEMWAALDVAQSSTFVREKENGLESRVEQGGQNFSGGQKQRLSIARAVVRDPEIYIFDDSFSALDFKTDSRLRKALRPITKDAAVIIVAQRIGTVMDADNILVMNNGQIVAQGKHEELIRNCQLYVDIALSQFSREELGI